MEGKGLLFKTYRRYRRIRHRGRHERYRKVHPKRSKTSLGHFRRHQPRRHQGPRVFRDRGHACKEELSIPVMHDDQHGTAIISAAALLNALEIAGKKIEKVTGSGQRRRRSRRIRARSFTSRWASSPRTWCMCDSKGVHFGAPPGPQPDESPIRHLRATSTRSKKPLSKEPTYSSGFSVADVLTPEMVRSMADNPIVFALANPNPEISLRSSRDAPPAPTSSSLRDVRTTRTRSTTCSDSLTSSAVRSTCGPRRSTRR